ncbi:MAG: GNAT family N-acetyltransferase [Candidatus Thermoplasmatota archaeon]
MEVKEVGSDALDQLYSLWRRTNGRYADKKDEQEFLLRYFENPSVTSRCYLLREKGNDLGAVLLESYDWGIYLYDWIEHRRDHVLEELIKQIDTLTEEKKMVILAPLFGRSCSTEAWKKVGFEKFEKAPYNILMKKEIEDDEGREIQVEIEALKDPSQENNIEPLAALLTEISGRWNDPVEMEKYLRWELKGDMDYWLAVMEGEPIGYCGIERRRLFSDDIMYWIKEVGVHPDERGKRIATDLLSHTIEEVRDDGGKEIYIDTHSENPAKELYEKLGFQTIEKVPNLRYEL